MLFDVTIAVRRINPQDAKRDPYRMMVNADNAANAIIRAVDSLLEDDRSLIHHINVVEYDGTYLDWSEK